MDYSRPALADRLAAEYVLGTLRGPARRRFEALLPAHPALRHATEAWEHRLVQLSGGVPAVTPSARVWTGVQKRLFGGTAAAAAAPVRWWQRARLWQGSTALASVAALVLGASLARTPPARPPTVILLSAQTGAVRGGALPVSFVASVGGDGRSLVLKPLDDHLPVALDRALELWAVPTQGTPRSLGLVSPNRATTVIRTGLLRGTSAFAVSVEPAGGSRSGGPTGPIISVGKLTL